MTTATAAPQPALGSVRLTLTPEATGDAIARIQRTDANGTYDVRTETSRLPYTGTLQPLTVDDYEASHGAVTYVVTTTSSGTTSTLTVQAELVLEGPWLGVPLTPQFGVRFDTVTDYSADVDTRATILEPEGRPDPVAILRGGGTRSGDLEAWCPDYPAALALLRLAQRPAVLQYRQAEHAGADMFLVVKRAGMRPAHREGAASRWLVTISYLEVGRPPGPLSGALGWTWEAVKNSFATWADLYASYASWGDVRTDTRKGS